MISIVSVRAVLAALDLGPALIEERRAKIIQTRSELCAWLTEKNIAFVPPQANYDGLSISYRQRASRWASGTLAYTWSHSLDLNQGNASDNIYLTDPLNTVYSGDYHTEKGSSHLVSLV